MVVREWRRVLLSWGPRRERVKSGRDIVEDCGVVFVVGEWWEVLAGREYEVRAV